MTGTDAEDMDRVKPGGLMRCCTKTLDGFYPGGPARKAREGEVLPCRWCANSMIFSGGFWQWNHPWERPR
jgi:hypothetical protein